MVEAVELYRADGATDIDGDVNSAVDFVQGEVSFTGPCDEQRGLVGYSHRTHVMSMGVWLATAIERM